MLIAEKQSGYGAGISFSIPNLFSFSTVPSTQATPTTQIPVYVPPTTTATNWTPILLLGGAGAVVLLLLYLKKKRT